MSEIDDQPKEETGAPVLKSQPLRPNDETDRDESVEQEMPAVHSARVPRFNADAAAPTFPSPVSTTPDPTSPTGRSIHPDMVLRGVDPTSNGYAEHAEAVQRGRVATMNGVEDHGDPLERRNTTDPVIGEDPADFPKTVEDTTFKGDLTGGNGGQ